MTTKTRPIVSSDKWYHNTWRPMMAYTYMAICIFDFIIGPIINFTFFRLTNGTFQPWVPMTTMDAGMFHMSMGAVLGVAAWTRGKEKEARITNGEYNDTANNS